MFVSLWCSHRPRDISAEKLLSPLNGQKLQIHRSGRTVIWNAENCLCCNKKPRCVDEGAKNGGMLSGTGKRWLNFSELWPIQEKITQFKVSNQSMGAHLYLMGRSDALRPYWDRFPLMFSWDVPVLLVLWLPAAFWTVTKRDPEISSLDLAFVTFSTSSIVFPLFFSVPLS